MFAGVVGQRRFKCCDQASNISSRPATGRGHEDKACVARTARRDQLRVKWPEVAQVGRDDRTLLTPRERNDISVGEAGPVLVLLDRLDIVPARA